MDDFLAYMAALNSTRRLGHFLKLTCDMELSAMRIKISDMRWAAS